MNTDIKCEFLDYIKAKKQIKKSLRRIRKAGFNGFGLMTLKIEGDFIFPELIVSSYERSALKQYGKTK